MMRRFPLLAALALALAPGLAAAAACRRVSSSGLAFGAYDVFSPAPLLAAGSVEYDCSVTVVPRVTLGAGGSGSYAGRELRSGAERLVYNLFLDASRTQVWGDGTAGTSTLYPAPANKGLESIPLYGIIYPGQDVAPGAYTDTVTISVIF